MNKKIIAIIMVGLILFTGCSLFGGSKTDYTKYVGVWKSNDSSIPEQEIDIKEIKDDTITFDIILYRLTDFNNIKASLEDGEATFEIKNELDWSIKGKIVLKDDIVKVTITDSSIELVEKTTYEFKTKSNTSVIRGTNVEPDVDVNSYIGVWRNDDSSNPVDEFIISTIDNNTITFDYLIDGITTFENGKATLELNKATFDVNNDLGWNIKGYFVMEDDKVSLTITDSSSEYIEKTTTVYELKRDTSNLK